MNLKSGKLLWLDSLNPSPKYPKLDKDISCEVIVVGGGEAGALVSYFLNKEGIDTVIIDKRSIAMGSSSANTGLIQYGNDKSLSSCINSFGLDKGIRYYKLCQEAVDILEDISDDLYISPHYIRRDSLYFASQKDDVEYLKNEFNLLKKYGFKVDYINKEEIEDLFAFSKEGAIYSYNDAEINPYRLAHGIIDKLYKKGVPIYEKTEIKSHVKKDNKFILHTKDGYKIKAHKVILATGYETQFIKRNPLANLISTYAMASQPISKEIWHGNCLIWETARPYLYLRTTSDNRILIGGLDETNFEDKFRDSKLLSKRDLLVSKVQELFPHINIRPEYFWSATFGETHDGVPLIGKDPDIDNLYYNLGYGGNGTVYSTLAGKILIDLILGKSNKDIEFFRLNRKKYSTK